jgi:hypothetical protein
VSSEDAFKALALQKIERFIGKYAKILGAPGPLPKLKLRNALSAGWFGRLTYHLSDIPAAEMEIQQCILGDDRTIERVVAHEMVHYDEARSLSPADIEQIRAYLQVGVKPQEHGKGFLQRAEQINKVMGQNFVSVTSDKEFVLLPNEKAYFVLIYEIISPRLGHPGRLGWSWAARISQKAKSWVEEKIAAGAKLVRVTDLLWSHGGAKIAKYGAFSVPSDPEREAKLAELFKSTPAVSP